MLCFRCGSYNHDGSTGCSVCEQTFSSDDNDGEGSSIELATSKLQAPYKRGDMIAERYRVRAVIGHGGVGTVFRVRDEEIDAEVALKTISPNLLQTDEERRLFSKSIRQARKLHHPNIIRIYDEGDFEDRRFYTMKLLEGLTLRKIIRLRHDKGQSFTPEEIGPIFHQLAAALDYAHKSTWHGDLKPENVIILPDLLKITDFNLLKGLPLKPFLGIAKSKSKGFPYIAPELRVEASRIDRRCDVYSLGVILAEMLTGLIFEGYFSRTMTAALERLPSKLDGMVRRAVAEHPDGRFNKASELAKELDSALDAVGDGGLPTPIVSEDEQAARVKKQPPPPPEETSPGLDLLSAENTAEDRPVEDDGGDDANAGQVGKSVDGEPREIGQSQVMLLETGVSDALADSRRHALVAGPTIPSPRAPRSERPDSGLPPPVGKGDEIQDTEQGNGHSLDGAGRVSLRAEDLIETLYSGDDDDESLVPPPLPSDEDLDASDSFDALPKGALAVRGEARGDLPSDEPFVPPPLDDSDENEPTLSDFGGKQRLRDDLASLQAEVAPKPAAAGENAASLMVDDALDANFDQASSGEIDKNIDQETTPSRPNPRPRKSAAGSSSRSSSSPQQPAMRVAGAPSSHAPAGSGAPASRRSSSSVTPSPSSQEVETKTRLPAGDDSMNETLDAASMQAVRKRSSPAAHSTSGLRPPVVKPSQSAAHLRPVAPPMARPKSNAGIFIAGGAAAIALVVGLVLLFAGKKGADETPNPPPVRVAAPGSTQVGPAGGVVELDGVTILIPGGALADERTIVIARTDQAPPAGIKALSPVFRFTPADTTFLTPATLTIPFDSAETDVALYWKRDGGAFERLSTGAAAGGSLASALDALGTGFVGRDDGTGLGAAGQDTPEPSPAVAVNTNTVDDAKVEEERRRAEEAKRREEDDQRRRNEEDRRKREDEQKKREQARQENDGDKARRDADRRAKNDMAAREAAERKERIAEERETRREERAIKREADKERKAEEKARRAEEKQRKDEARRKKAEEKAEEDARKRDEKKARDEEKARKAEEARVASVKKATCPKGMVTVPAGSFAFGSSPSDPMRNFGEKTATTVSSDAFCIDYYEFPNSSKHVPTTNVSWKRAKRSCAKKGKRLCSEREWERACKGPSNRRFPYGNAYKVDRCNTEDGSGQPRDLASAREFKKCRSKFNVFMMSGNAEEWTADNFRGGAGSKAVKGGASDRPDWASRCSARRGVSPSSKKSTLGFRCCADSN